jgi:protein-tyrosine phosphatase
MSNQNSRQAERVLKVMAVCTGNICRSAMAEVVLQCEAKKLAETSQIQAHFEIASSGISSEEQGNPMDYRAQNTLRKHGYDAELLKTHRAKKITHAEIKQFDLFLPMTAAHARNLEGQGAPKDKIFMWRWFENFGNNPLQAPDLADPWYGGIEDFEIAYSQIQESAREILLWANEHLPNYRA